MRWATSAWVSPARDLASMSWLAALPEDERADLLERFRAVIQAGDTPAEMPVHVAIGLTALA